jgi:hypothetical protein
MQILDQVRSDYERMHQAKLDDETVCRENPTNFPVSFLYFLKHSNTEADLMLA